MSERMKVILIIIFTVILAAYTAYWSSKSLQTLTLYECLQDTSCYAYKDTNSVTFKDPISGKERTYRNKYARAVTFEFKRINKFFPLLGDDSDKTVSIITACCSASLVGVSVFLLININFRRIRYKLEKAISIILLGLLMGAVAFIIVQFAPSLLFKTTPEFKDAAIYAIALLAGMFSESFYNRLAILFK